MDWNRAIKKACRTAELKRSLARARIEMIYISNHDLDEFIREEAFGYIYPYIETVVSEYENIGEFKQVEQLKKILKMPSETIDQIYEFFEESCNFFVEEDNFYSSLIKKYNRFLKVQQPEVGNQQLYFYGLSPR